MNSTNKQPKNEATVETFDFTKFKAPALIALCVLFVAVVVFAGFSVYDLFANRLNAQTFEAALAVVASVGVAVVTLFVVLTTRHMPTRGAGAIILIAWVGVVLALVGTNSALRGGLFAVPEALSNVGQVAAGLLAALALIPAIVIPLTMNDRSDYGSAAEAAGKYVGFMAKGAGILASTIASAYFGISRGINPMLAVVCGVVLETCFLWAYLKLIGANRARDEFDAWLWRVAVVAFGVFISLVSVETLSTLAGIRVPIVSMFGEAGASLYVSAIGLSVILTIAAHVVTSAIDFRDVDGDGRPDWTVAGERVNQPAPSPQLAKDSPPALEANVAEDVPARKTGEVVMEDEDAGDGSPARPKR